MFAYNSLSSKLDKITAHAELPLTPSPYSHFTAVSYVSDDEALTFYIGRERCEAFPGLLKKEEKIIPT